MRNLVIRWSGVALAAAALAACSGAQPYTPGSAGLSSQPGQPASVAAAQQHVITVTPENMAFARTFQFGQPRILYTKQRNPATNAMHPNTPGYPLDMHCPFPLAGYTGGKCTTMPSSTAYNVYISPDGKKCTTESCWGKPEEFLKQLTGSKFAGLITQYTGGKASGYTYGGNVAVKYPLNYSKVMYGNDLGNVLAAAAAHFGKVGLTYEYHLFLPPGYDTCFDETAQCYSPDNPPAFAFCAYHSYAYVPAIKNYIIYSVEPYAFAKVSGSNNYGCPNSSPSVKPSLKNFQASVLGHESFESWSDPVQSYTISGNLNYYGQEIGDVCAYLFFTNFGKAPAFNVQTQYSNAVHACNNQ